MSASEENNAPEIWAPLRRKVALLAYIEYRGGHLGSYSRDPPRLRKIRGCPVVKDDENPSIGAQLASNESVLVAVGPSSFLSLRGPFLSLLLETGRDCINAGLARLDRATRGYYFTEHWRFSIACLKLRERLHSRRAGTNELFFRDLCSFIPTRSRRL